MKSDMAKLRAEDSPCADARRQTGSGMSILSYQTNESETNGGQGNSKGKAETEEKEIGKEKWVLVAIAKEVYGDRPDTMGHDQDATLYKTEMSDRNERGPATVGSRLRCETQDSGSETELPCTLNADS